MSTIKTKFIADNNVTNAKLAQMAANTVKANVTGSTANASDISATSSATASAFAVRDANANLSVNNLLEGYATTITAAGTTVLSVSSAYLQYFTGSSTQTVTLPSATTLALGQSYVIVNNSTGAVTVNNNGGTTQVVMTANSQAILTCTSISSGNGVWSLSYTYNNLGFYRAGQQSILQTYTFTVTSANATVGATFTNNGQTFTVINTIAAGTTLVCNGTGAPTASGTLTKASGTGDATITFASSTNALPTSQVINFSSAFSSTSYAPSIVWKIQQTQAHNSKHMKLLRNLLVAW